MAIPGKESDNGVYEFPYGKNPNQSKWEALYNPRTKEFLGRNSKSWAQLLLFYTIFYAILAALFAICMEGLLWTIDDHEPKWQLDSGLIGTNPGLGFRPISNRTEDGSLIWYNTTQPESSQKWIDLLDQFFQPYNAKIGTNPNQIPCDFGVSPGQSQSCAVNTSLFGPCGPETKYGYNTMSPCIFLKLNKIYGWQPDLYLKTDTLPDEMPEDLQDHIMNAKSQNQSDQVWVSCKGHHASDRENLIHGFRYFPTGFPAFYYPYTNAKGYLSPLVAVQINDPNPNVLINIECRAWAKNIQYFGGTQERRQGSVKFEIMIDV